MQMITTQIVTAKILNNQAPNPGGQMNGKLKAKGDTLS